MVHYGLAENGTLSSGVATTANSAGTSAITSATLYSDTVYYTVAQNSGQVMCHMAGGAVQQAGDDLLIAGQNDTVIGGDGDDILVVASGAQLSGGAGADRFIMAETDSATRILDFTRGEDIIDMSSYFMLRSADQITVNGSSSGARVQVRDTLIEVRSSDGMSLSAEDLFSRLFDWADRIPILEATYAPPTAPTPTPAPDPGPVPTPNPITSGGGTDAGMVLIGAGGSDTLWGGE